MAKQTFSGETKEAPFLSADFWEEGKSFKAIVNGMFEVDGRKNYTLSLLTPHELSVPVQQTDGTTEEVETNVVSLGESAGLRMAFLDARIPNGLLLAGDRLVLTCKGKTPSKKAGQSDRVDFRVVVERENVAIDEEVGF
jgi:hypothetical protein